MTNDMELVNKIFSEPNLDNLQKDLRALDPHLKESLRMLESMTKSSSGCWSDNSSSSSSDNGRLFNRGGRNPWAGPIMRPYSSVTKGSNLRGDAPVFMPSSYAAAVSKVPRMPSLESTPRFVVPIVRKTRPPFSNNNDKPIPDITANNLPRPPIRMTPATLKKFSTPEIVLPVFQASFQISAKSINTTLYNTHASFRKHCEFCKNNGCRIDQYQSHCLRNPLTGRVICPVLREYVCEVCKSTGDDAHIESNCPLNLIAKDNPTLVKLTLHNGLSEAKTR
ncbi:uncharacterized protein [Lepeophtheirus salmonis]|uniref:uncharacterized protein isoform X2 n=1 Tax=Lepeophtheirus salmonis TaxID=72036 RepID=UPI001AE5792B|nr:uncharacterized protein LOC121128765 isoform X2 [Lepeophtheirus salmonis]